MKRTFSIGIGRAIAALFILVLSTTSVLSNAEQRASSWWQITLLPHQARYTIGQEVRLRLQSPVRVNASSQMVAMRVIAAYPNRGSTGTRQLCNSSSADVWQHFGDLGTQLPIPNTTVAFATMTVPPFPWRVCVSDYDTTWSVATGPSAFREVGNFEHLPFVFGLNESRHFYNTSAEPVAGDYAAIRILSAFPTVSPSSYRGGLDGDTVKLVPAGTPCSTEKLSSRELRTGTRSTDYCGTNSVNRTTGWWTNPFCLQEGSVGSGVARMGTLNRNPFVDGPWEATVNADLVAYLKLPSAGSYDICYSPLWHRRRLAANWPLSYGAVPVWFKLFKLGNDGCALDAVSFPSSCKPRTMKFTVLSVSAFPSTWSAPDLTPASWTALKIDGSNLNSFAAQNWDCLGCSSINYFHTAGGDQIRLVPEAAFASTSETVSGSFFSGARLSSGLLRRETSASGDYATYRYTMRFSGFNLGTATESAGCWTRKFDNYGWRGAQLNAARDTIGGDSGSNGATASGDLGGDPRSGLHSHLQNVSGTSAVYAYIRVPAFRGFRFRVCYRKGGTNNWRSLAWNTAVPYPVEQNMGIGNLHLIPFPKPSSANISIQINDTRAATWAEAILHSRVPRFTTMPSNLFTSSVADADVRSIGFKLVTSGVACSTDDGENRTTRWDHGLPECSPADCLPNGCGLSQCWGSADDSNTLRRTIAIRFMIPSTIRSYRLCLKVNTDNWQQIGLLTPTSAPQLA